MTKIEDLPVAWRELGMRATDVRTLPGAAPETLAFFQCAADLERILSGRKPIGVIVQIGGDFEKVKSDASALWAVRVLDAWRKRGIMRRWKMTEGISTSAPICRLMSDSLETKDHFGGGNEDAARFVAARSVYPELPSDVRAELGECP